MASIIVTTITKYYIHTLNLNSSNIFTILTILLDFFSKNIRFLVFSKCKFQMLKAPRWGISRCLSFKTFLVVTEGLVSAQVGLDKLEVIFSYLDYPGFDRILESVPFLIIHLH